MKYIFCLHRALLLTAAWVTLSVAVAKAQTLELLPVNTFFQGSQVENMTKLPNGNYVFFANDGANGTQLWKTDGTAAGTVRLQAPGTHATGFTNLPSLLVTEKKWVIVGNEVYFTVDEHLFHSSGNSLQLLASGGTFSELTVSGSVVYFKQVIGSPEVASLWKTDGTVAGTVQLKVFDGSATHSLRHLTNVNGTLYFQGYADGVVGYELFKSDGTAAGTVMLKDIQPDATAVHLSDLTAAGNYLYFRAREVAVNSARKEWWRSDGTAAGTVRVTNYGNFTNSFTVNSLPQGDNLYVSMAVGTSTSPTELWKLTPGSSDLNTPVYTSTGTIALLQLINDKLYFTEPGVFPNSYLKVTDGTAQNTFLLQSSFNRTTSTTGPDYFYPLNGYYYYITGEGPTTTRTWGLWRTDGTPAGTTPVANNIVRGFFEFRQVGNMFYFQGREIGQSSVNIFKLWKSDGTTAGTVKITDRDFTAQVRASAGDGTNYYFTSTDTVWAADGSGLKDIPLGSPTTMQGLRPSGIYPVADKIMATARLSVVTNVSNYDLFVGSTAAAPQAQTISFADITGTYGDADLAPGGTATSGLTVEYEMADPTIATIVNGNIHILKAGTTTVTAKQPGNASWLPAAVVIKTLTVNKAPLTITAEDKTRDQGAPNPALTVSYSGFVNGETASALTTPPTITTTAQQNSPAGTYPITASGAAADNYTISFVDGTLTVLPPAAQPQTITFADMTKSYGQADFEPGAAASSGLTVTYTSDNPAVAVVVDGKIHLAGAGTAHITAAQAGNAFFTPAAPVTQLLTVNKAQLNIRADDKSKLHNEGNPVLTVSYTGFVNGDIFTALSKQPVLATTAVLHSVPGTYPITVSGAGAANYDITYTDGTLTVKAFPVKTDRLEALFTNSTLQVKIAAAKQQKAVLQLIDVTGRVLLTQDLSLVDGINTFQLPAFNIASGAYLVQVRGEGLKLSDKIIK